MSSDPGIGAQPVLRGLTGYGDLEIIAHGGSAIVYRGTQERLGRQVAIKVLTLDEMTTSHQFERELDLTVRLSSHPHIVSIIDTGHTDHGSPYIVMEYCPGGSYGEILRKQGPRSVAEVIDIGIKIGEALHAAHGVGIVHRDVKPPNILRSAYGPALTDFGIARAAGDLSNTYTSEKLTPYHASPEALDQRPQSTQSDIYSLASTLWHLLAGRAPFIDPNERVQDAVQFRLRVLSAPVPPMPVDGVPDWLEAELRRALSKDPARRHDSAMAFADALRGGSSRAAPWTVPATGAPTSAAPAAPLFPPDFGPDTDDDSSGQPGQPGQTGQFGQPGQPGSAGPAFTWPPPPASTSAAGTAAGASPPIPSAPGQAPPGQATPPGIPGIPTPGQPAPPPAAPGKSSSGLMKPLMIAGAVGVVLGLIVIAITVVIQFNRSTPDDATLTSDMKPTDVKLAITGTTAKVTWSDHTNNKASHLVALYPKGSNPTKDNYRTVPAGISAMEMQGIDPTTRHCATVAAFVGSGQVAASDPICQN